MTPQQAINILATCAARYRGTLEEHQDLQSAVQVLTQVIAPKVEAKPEPKPEPKK